MGAWQGQGRDTGKGREGARVRERTSGVCRFYEAICKLQIAEQGMNRLGKVDLALSRKNG